MKIKHFENAAKIVGILCLMVILGALVRLGTKISPQHQLNDVLATAPVLDSVAVAVLSGGQDISGSTAGSGVNPFSLIENTTTTLYVSGVAHDDNGCDDIEAGLTSWTLDVYRTDANGGASCSPDGRSCYDGTADGSSITTSNCTPGGADFDLDFEWRIPINYYADATDTGDYASSDWSARVSVADTSLSLSNSITRFFEVATLRALNISSGISYPAVSLGEYTSEQPLVIINSGNSIIDVEISADGNMICDSGSIDVSNTLYSTTQGSPYGEKVGLSTSPTAVDLNLIKTTDGTPSTSTLYLNLHLPEVGAGGNCANTIQVNATAGS